MSTSRKQCAKCPWKVETNPRDIPGEYCEDKHVALENTIAEPGLIPMNNELRMMACHESVPGKEVPCVGWLVHQLGEGNNIQLRMAVAFGQIDANVETVGRQHGCLEDTLP